MARHHHTSSHPSSGDYTQESSDLGFGAALSSQPQLRLLNRDGSFNLVRRHASGLESRISFRSLLDMSWLLFFTLLCGSYIGINLIFALGFLACGPGALSGQTPLNGFWRDFFFSVHTFATIGYGNITPASMAANILVTVESITGLLMFALATGLIFSRFSRPIAHILYSRIAVIAPYRGISAWEFRIINARQNQLIDLQVRITLAYFPDPNALSRVYHQLRLERPGVAFFPMSWTVVHPIDESSPLQGWTRKEMMERKAEFLILITATDETYSQTVHSRSSYIAGEVLWGARFVPMLKQDDHQLTVDLSCLNRTEAAELPPGSPEQPSDLQPPAGAR